VPLNARLDDLASPAVASAATKLREALELFDDGVALQRLAFARQNPGLDDEGLDKLLTGWLRRENDEQ
jgi:Rv0078B-related antitoxin